MVYDAGGRIFRLKWLFGWVLGIGYWDGVIVVMVLWMYGFGCRCGSRALVCVLCVCMGVNTVLVWWLVGCCLFIVCVSCLRVASVFHVYVWVCSFIVVICVW